MKNNKIQAQLTCYLDSNLITATSNKDGLHVVFDDTGKSIGVYDGDGHLREDVYFDEDSGFILYEENDEIVESPNLEVEDLTPDNVYEEREKDKNKTEIIETIKEILSIGFIVVGIFIVIKIISSIVSLIRDKSLNRNIKQTNKILRQQNKNKRKRRR